MIKMDNFQYFSIKSYVVDVWGDSNTHPKHMILCRTYDKVKILVFCENFMSTETFT